MAGKENIGYLLRQLRRLSGCTQEEVANGPGMSQAHLREIEHGRSDTTFQTAERAIGYMLSRMTGREWPADLCRLETLLEGVTLWRYRLVTETRYREDTGWYPTYAVAAERNYGGRWEPAGMVHDVSLSWETASDLVRRMNRSQLSPVHLLEAVGDMLP